MGALSLTAACSDNTSDADRIEARLNAGARALEDNKIADAAEVLAEAYRDVSKRDKTTMKRLAFVARRQGPLSLYLRDFKIVIAAPDTVTRDGDAPNGTTATVNVDVYAVQGANEMKKAADLIPERARKHAIELDMKKIDGEWQVTSMAGDRLGTATF